MLRVLGTSREWTDALEEILRTCDDITIVAPWVDSSLGRWPVWQTMRFAQPRIRQVYVAAEDARSEPAALSELHGWGVLRWLPVGDASMRASLVRGTRAGTTITLFGAAPLAPAGLLAPLSGATLHEGSGLDAFDLQMEGLVGRVARAAQVPTRTTLDAYYAAYIETKDLRERILAVAAPLSVTPHVESPDLDLEVVVGSAAIARAFRTLEGLLGDGATSTRRHTLAFHGGREELEVCWFAPLGFWSAQQRLDGRFRNAFGLDTPTTGLALSITVEINFPASGLDRKVGGAVASCRSTGSPYLVHRGKIGGGAKGVGAELFWSRFRGGTMMKEPLGEKSRVVPVARLDAPTALADIAGFVHEVGRIKRLAGTQSRR